MCVFVYVLMVGLMSRADFKHVETSVASHCKPFKSSIARQFMSKLSATCIQVLLTLTDTATKYIHTVCDCNLRFTWIYSLHKSECY